MTTDVRPMPSIRMRLLQLAAACIVPAVLMAAALVVHDYVRERELLLASTLTTVRSVSDSLDAELAQPRQALAALAGARLLRAGRWMEFLEQMRELEPALDVAALFLVGDDGRLLLHTGAASQRGLPALPQVVDVAAGYSLPSVTGLVTDPVTGRAGAAVLVPLPPGTPARALGAWLSPRRVLNLLQRQQLPPHWIATVVDASGTVVARSHEMDRFLGRKGPPLLLDRLPVQEEAIFEASALDGTAVVAIYSRSRGSGWAVAVGLPRAAMLDELQRRAAWLAAGALGLLLATLGGAWWLGGRIVRSIDALREPTAAMGRGEEVHVPPVSFREAQMLGEALHETSQALRAASAGLVRSNLDLQQFAFVASHDMRGPLNTTGAYLDLLGRKYGAALPEGALNLVDRASQAIRHLDRLTEALLGYARLDAQRRPFTDVDMKEVLQDCLAALDAPLRDAQAQVTQGDLPVVRGDRTQLAQLVQNLVGNAIKYRGPRPALVHVASQQLTDGWRFEVSDNGIGIEPRHQERIFEIFKRLHQQHEIPGTGIGLAICKRVVQAHGGDIGVTSEPGRGSTFWFTVKTKKGQP
jgi:signal transduction histidine kinase